MTMTRDEMIQHLKDEFGMDDLTIRNLMFVAFKGQNAWFGGSQSPNRLVCSQQDGYQVLADGYVIPEG